VKLGRPGQHEPAHSGISIDYPLQVGEQVGTLLRLIEHGAVGVAGQKSTRVTFEAGSNLGVFKGHVGAVVEDGAA
jgi:hypothetical protein